MNDESLSAAELYLREEAATRAFLEPQEITATPDLTLRPISITSIFQLRQTKNEFLAPRGPVRQLPHPETGLLVESATMENEFLALLGFAFIHGAPESEVDASVFHEALFQKRVQAFGRQIPPDRFPYLMKEIAERFVEMKKLEFGVKKKPKEGASGPTPPPN